MKAEEQEILRKIAERWRRDCLEGYEEVAAFDIGLLLGMVYTLDARYQQLLDYLKQIAPE